MLVHCHNKNVQIRLFFLGTALWNVIFKSCIFDKRLKYSQLWSNNYISKHHLAEFLFENFIIQRLNCIFNADVLVKSNNCYWTRENYFHKMSFKINVS